MERWSIGEVECWQASLHELHHWTTPITPGRSIRRLHTFDGTLPHPRHERTQPGPNLFNGMFFALMEQRVVAFVAGLVLLDPALGEFAGLNFLQRRCHPLLNAGVDNLRANRHVTPLGRFGYG